MRIHQRLMAGSLALACIAVAAATAAPARAAVMMTAAHLAPAGQKIAVKTCSPTRSITRTPVGPYGRVGFAPGFYPPGPYYWDDAFGYPYYQPPLVVNQSGSLQIDYVNVTHQTMETIDFGLVANGKLVAEVRDVGTFSPNIEIKHQFGLNPNVFPLGTALPQCLPLRITYKDQATWVNPHLAALKRAIYESP